MTLPGEGDAAAGRGLSLDARDRTILDEKADELDREMEDVLAYQATPARRRLRQ